MGFFDEYKDLGGGSYVGREEKDVLIDNAVPFKVHDVVYQEESRFGERYVLKVVLPDSDDERLMSFSRGTVESRDNLLVQLMEYLNDADNEPETIRLERVGRSVLIRPGA